MSEKLNPSSQKARDEALRALVQRAGLTPDQVSELKLSQVHLATGTLVIEPDEFDPSTPVGERPLRVMLDAAMQRALIGWLVVRPDGPNDHLFPGPGTAGLDAATINEVMVAKRPAAPPQAVDSVEPTAPPRTESKIPETLPESVPPRPREVEGKARPAPPPPPVAKPGEEPVPLDEIELLRRRLAESYDAWAPAVTAATVRRTVEPPPGVEVPSSARGREVEPAVAPQAGDEIKPVVAPAPGPKEALVAPVEPKPAREPRPAMPPPYRPVKPAVTEPARDVDEAAPAPASSRGVADQLKDWWKPSEGKVTLNLSFRTLAFGGLALLLVVCCVGLVAAGGSMLGSGAAGGLLAGATPTGTPTPTPVALSATFTLVPSPTATTTSTLSPPPSATPTPSPAPTNTQAPTSTPLVIVVTATLTPEPSPTATRVPTNTPEGGPPPEPTATETPGFKYPAPVLVWPEDGSTVPGVINILQWEPVGPLADDEWYTVRLIYRQQGQAVYAGDRVKVPEWRVPDRLYYQADGPDLEYSWYVFVERDNPDGSATQLSPSSETFVFRWE